MQASRAAAATVGNTNNAYRALNEPSQQPTADGRRQIFGNKTQKFLFCERRGGGASEAESAEQQQQQQQQPPQHQQQQQQQQEQQQQQQPQPPAPALDQAGGTS
jgi:hypothetical protein